MTKIIIWNEYIHEIENNDVKKIYPNGIHNCIKDFLSKAFIYIINYSLETNHQKEYKFSE